MQQGVITKTGRGFWGGIAENGDIVVTNWLEDHKDRRRRINKPFTNHGGLRRAWDGGDIVIGAKVRVILTDRSSSLEKTVKAATVLSSYWRVVELGQYAGHHTAWVEPIIESAGHAR